jgi:hypothetical protein
MCEGREENVSFVGGDIESADVLNNIIIVSIGPHSCYQ